MNTLADRLRHRRKELKLSQEDLGKKIGVSQSSIGNIESGRNRSATFLPQLADALGISALWLAEGKGPMISNNPLGGQSNASLSIDNDEATRILAANQALKAGEISLEEYAEHTNSIALPFYEIKASCGTGELTFEVISHQYFTDKNELNRLGLKPEHTFWCRAAGDSMEPTVKDGDRLLVEQLDGHSLTDILNNRIYLFSWNGELFCKRLIRQMDGSLLVKSDNSENHRDTLITTEQIGQMKLIGRVRQAHTPPTML
ncbi:XRE family transcriptional regulator [Deefgea rivuli]|uniref:XRE family transcriptional regulator n=1 Tax=Deefgea rivuli TaxID=400948 RepID=UPI000563076C|nr:S24 family peptidase [Deefgea rivuli]